MHCSLRRIASFFPSPLRPQGVLHHGRSPFFTTSASEFFIPLARAVFMTSETSPSPLPKKSLPRAIPMPRFMPPACCARPLARLTGFASSVGYVSRGQAPWLLYAAPPSGGALILPRLPPRGNFPTPRMRGATAIASAWTHRDTDAGTTRTRKKRTGTRGTGDT